MFASAIKDEIEDIIMTWDKIFDTLYEFGTSFGLRIIETVIILIVGLKLSKWTVKMIAKSHGFQKLDMSLQTFIKSFVSIALNALVIITAAVTIGIPATSFITVLASAAAAIGLALQGALSNFAGGLMLLFFKPFKIGDYIDVGSSSGTVKSITVFYTVINTVDNKQITLPNGNLTNSPIVNYSANDTRMVDVEFSTAYDADTDTVRRVVLETAQANEKVNADPAPKVLMSSHGDSAINFILRVWCSTGDYWDVKFGLTERIKSVLDENGIEIPFPQLDVHLDNGSSDKKADNSSSDNDESVE